MREVRVNPAFDLTALEVIDSSALSMPPFTMPSTRIEMTRNEAGQLEVLITTQRLQLQSVRSTDADLLYKHIYGSPDVMALFQNGTPWTREHFDKRLGVWTSRWEQGDPFSAYVVRTRDAEFAGIAVMGHGSVPGRSEIAFAIRRAMWGLGYGNEAMQAVAGKFASLLRAQQMSVDGQAFHEIEATVQADNIPSVKIIDSLGMTQCSAADPLAATAAQYIHARRLYVREVRSPQEPMLDTVLDCGSFHLWRSLL